MSKINQRANSIDEFRMINRRTQKENQNQNNRTLDEKLLLIEKQLAQNESYNDQYLLTNSIEANAVPMKTQNQSISFNLQSIENDRFNSKKNSIMEECQKKSYDSMRDNASKYQSNNNDSALVMLLNEFERRFEQIEERLQLSEKTNRQYQQNNKSSADYFNGIQEKLTLLLQRIGKFELKLKQLDEAFQSHKNQTDKRIIEYNQHVDQSLKSFLDVSIQIQKKIERITSKDNLTEVEVLKQKTDNLTYNLQRTHDLLNQQMNDFSQLQQSVNQVIREDYFNNLFEEIETIKDQYSQTMQYLKELQEFLIK
ncbi:unnamed protein product (macronuclear) [Paramecium tetraurelia]|uniref:SF-assemblin n=1 Tax=Paramecium tetraurelia TaxID=5888 RepID=A0CRQ2_PARTE|nr:uncharacterized protein GSPATT00009784001 [Paramecium tetraurelia]CAK73469.1 unnamed protein product [Paramecium tetraurelia]|eukprot:XP_001440866.1 hypothetical protein (macronuclear) [Paramecium tetraurelia strain d4-2]